jgi:DNA-binding CsgD family transcriptional regulator/N-acetylneuraminic acid mutarotase
MPERNEPLSERELDILRLVASGKANKEIANQLVISPNTVKVHLRNIFAKIGVVSRTEATLYAVKIGLVRPHVASQVIETGPDDGTNSEPQTGIEKSEADTSQALPAQKSKTRLPAWLLALLIMGALLLIAGLGIMGARVIGERLRPMPTPLPAISAASTPQVNVVPRWTKRSDLPSPRKGMAVIEYENNLYIVAGETSQGIDGALLRFSQAENTWSTLASKPTPVTDIQAALVSEKIYVPGGRLANGSATDRLEVYDPRKGTWENRAPLPEPLSAYGMTFFEGQIYLFGGKNGEQYSASVYVYDPQEDRWTTRTSMSSPRAYTSVVESGGKIYVMGGYDGQHALNSNEAYLPNRDISGESPWKAFAPLPEGRYAMSTAQLVGIIYLVGGLGENGQPAGKPAIQYSVQVDQWMEFETPPVKIGTNSALLPSGKYLYILGGETPEGLSAANLAYQAIYTITVPILINNGN